MTYATFFRDELVVFFVINYLRNIAQTELFLMNFQNRGKKKLLIYFSNCYTIISQFHGDPKSQIPTKPHYNQKDHLASLGCLNVFNPLAGLK